ncbi:hypothetical protein F53441_7883 [Fusarium austroafricanum]|uniref:Uncharacterized protein n=1 Tax=Fusarium austroafricanum TaxID=2364996 RepID=A0A8H4NV05_9HYPO|nr:hypothetical protein F53441_7883 [Fusarium austroafricanum]
MQLLSDKVYESTSIAGQRFPDLFESSMAQTTARAQLEEEATRSEQATLNDITQTHQDDSQDAFSSAETTTAVYDASNSTVSGEVDIASLFPVHLPFPIEHLLMEKLQKILELACYQHTAVHRLRTNSTGLERFLADAEDLAAVLGDNIYTRAISQLRLDARSTLAELTRNKEIIQLQLEKAQEEIAKQRAELDEEERENLRQMQREDDKYRALAGERLEKALHVLGDLKVVSNNENTVLNGVDGDEAVTISDDDSEFDRAEQFEDCSEA